MLLIKTETETMNRYKVELQKQQRKAYEDLFKQDSPNLDCSEDFTRLMTETVDPQIEKAKSRQLRDKIMYYLKQARTPEETVSNPYYQRQWPNKKPQPKLYQVLSFLQFETMEKVLEGEDLSKKNEIYEKVLNHIKRTQPLIERSVQ